MEARQAASGVPAAAAAASAIAGTEGAAAVVPHQF